MRILSDMHKWRRHFVWRMVGFTVLLPILAGGMVFEAWYFRAKVLANFQQMLIPTLGIIFAVVAMIYAEFMCIKIIISTRKHGAEIRRRERDRPPLTLSRLREELQSENQVQFRMATAKMLQSSSPQARAIVETSMDQLVARYRTDLGSTPEAEAELMKLEALIAEVLKQSPGS